MKKYVNNSTVQIFLYFPNEEVYCLVRADSLTMALHSASQVAGTLASGSTSSTPPNLRMSTDLSLNTWHLHIFRYLYYT